MPPVRSSTITIFLLATGISVFAWTATRLLTDKQAIPPLNPLGVNRSPYGEVFAMAMQAPIDSTFHMAWDGGGHRHSGNGSCETCDRRFSLTALKTGGGFRMEKLLALLEEAAEQRTNSKPVTAAHRFFLRRQTENKLRFAWNLDPAHYANYTSLHFFLTEPQLGTRPQLTPTAAKLAADTISYCLTRTDDPRPALTAAAAASNVLELMFNDRAFRPGQPPRFTVAQMRENLALLDFCIARHRKISTAWERSGNWKNLSPQRIAECQDRLSFVLKFREAAVDTIARLDTGSAPPRSHASSLSR